MTDHLLKMFFQNWTGLLRTVIVGVMAYLALVTLLRVTGKRTLSKMNAFDLIVTVALGSVLATILLSKDVPLAEGVVAFGLLVSMQYIITWLSVRYRRLTCIFPYTLAARLRSYVQEHTYEENETEKVR